MTETTIGQALYEEAQRKILANFTLTDWQVAENPDIPCNEPTRTVKVSATDTRLDIFSSNNKLIFWIEFHAGQLVLHAYDDQHESPVTLRVDANCVEVEFDDQSINTDARE